MITHGLSVLGGGMESRGSVPGINAEVFSIVEWFEREVDNDAIIKKRTIETDWGTVSIGGAFVRGGERTTSATMVISAFFIDSKGSRTPIPVQGSWPWALWFTVSPLSRGEVELEWFCTHDSLRSYWDELLNRFCLKFKVERDLDHGPTTLKNTTAHMVTHTNHGLTEADLLSSDAISGKDYDALIAQLLQSAREHSDLVAVRSYKKVKATRQGLFEWIPYTLRFRRFGCPKPQGKTLAIYRPSSDSDWVANIIREDAEPVIEIDVHDFGVGSVDVRAWCRGTNNLDDYIWLFTQFEEYFDARPENVPPLSNTNNLSKVTRDANYASPIPSDAIVDGRSMKSQVTHRGGPGGRQYMSNGEYRKLVEQWLKVKAMGGTTLAEFAGTTPVSFDVLRAKVTLYNKGLLKD